MPKSSPRRNAAEGEKRRFRQLFRSKNAAKPGLTPLRFYPEYPSTKQCPLILLGSGRPVRLIDGETKPFDPDSQGACIAKAPGYSMVYDAAVRTQSSDESIGFLKQQLLQP